ncbi:MAG: glycosyltransferase [Gammaproteobacteria bacterium]|nr:glycosyltransferase [Gammaproteobacteria bacterium]
MKVSGFTFVRNGEQLGYPFIQSIRSALPIVDEFIAVVGESDDATLHMIQTMNEPKIKIIQTQWNPHIKNNGFILAQQKMIAQYACTGDWALYIEADELLHEKDYPNIKAAMQRHLHNPDIEALVFNYLHFYGNINTFAWAPNWYRRAARIIKPSVRNFAPDGLYWTVLINNKKTRYPKAALANATMYHYGYVRHSEQMQAKIQQLNPYYNQNRNEPVRYEATDPNTLHLFQGTHSSHLGGFFDTPPGLFQADNTYTLNKRERKNRLGLKLEHWLKKDLSRRHFTLALKAERHQPFLLADALQI